MIWYWSRFLFGTNANCYAGWSWIGDIEASAFSIWYDMIWYDMIWYDMIWYDIPVYHQSDFFKGWLRFATFPLIPFLSSSIGLSIITYIASSVSFSHHCSSFPFPSPSLSLFFSVRHAQATAEIFRSIMIGHDEVNIQKSVSVGMENGKGDRMI